MSATYEPGTMAVATVRGVPNVRVIARTHATRADRVVWMVPGDYAADDSDVTDVRPLVVIDPEDREQVERLAQAYLNEFGSGHPAEAIADQIQSALRSLIAPPKPLEPTDLGAQVRDCDGETWVRNAQGAWINLHGRYGLDPARTWDGLCEKYGPIEVTA